MDNEIKDVTASHTTETARNAWQDAAGRVQQFLEPFRGQAQSAYSTAQQRSTEALGAAEDYIKRSPLRAIAYTAGVAALLGIVGTALLGRRGKDAKKPGQE